MAYGLEIERAAADLITRYGERALETAQARLQACERAGHRDAIVTWQRIAETIGERTRAAAEPR